jgi:ABC-type Zn uptake system ZnuABC Zn-binding protein ZnuA
MSRVRSAVLALALALPACSTSAGSATDHRLRVVTTVAPITSIVAVVGGDRIRVTGLVPEGTNSHTFEPPPSAAEVLSKADLIFVNGLRLEDPTAELAAQNKKRGAEIVALGTTVLPESRYIYDFSFPKKDGKPNPHLWTDPLFAIEYARVVRDRLAARDPVAAGYFTANLDRFTASAAALSDAMRAAGGTVAKRELLTYHDGYAYFARDYGWHVIGAIQPSNFEDPTPREVAALIAQIKARKVPAIFGSEVFPSKVLAEIGRATGARYVDTLRDDDLPGAPGDPDHSWFGLMRNDFVTMVTALGGDATALTSMLPRGTQVDVAKYPQ